MLGPIIPSPPWSYDESTATVYDEDGYRVCRLDAGPRADAAGPLVAASPRLAQALASLVGWCEALDFDGHVYIADACDEARAYLKAAGWPAKETHHDAT